MDTEKGWFFQKLDEYTRNWYQHFVAELFLTHNNTRYTICLRPVNASPNTPNQHSCHYLYIDKQTVELAFGNKELTSAITNVVKSKFEPGNV